MKILKASTFKDLFLNNKDNKNGFYYSINKEIRFVNFIDFWKMVEDYPIKDAHSVGIFCNQSLETLIAIFAYANKKTQIVLLDINNEEEVLKKQIIATDVDLLIGDEELCESLTPYLDPQEEGKKGNILFFTSGTTSSSKAVILTESSLCASAYNGALLLPLSEDDVLLSMLPLNHVFGFVCSLLWGVVSGTSIALSRGRRFLFEDFMFYHPTAVSLVPQMVEYLLKKNLFNPELKKVLVGAGDCSPLVLKEIKSQDIEVHFGYGLTETSSGVALSLGEDPSLMTPVKEANIKIADDGEILVHAPSLLMVGFYKDEVKTDSAIKDGYLHTGDLGVVNENGLLKIIGRKKEIYVLNDGLKIFLPEFEGELKGFLKTDLAVLQDENKQLVLALERPIIDIDYKLELFNVKHNRSSQIQSYFILNKPLPRTSTGKIKRYAIEIVKK